MMPDRRSYKLGIAASLLLFAGLSAGILLTTHFGWLPVANGNPPAAAVNAGLPGESPSNFVNVVKAATPAAVNISTTRVIQRRGDKLFVVIKP